MIRSKNATDTQTRVNVGAIEALGWHNMRNHSEIRIHPETWRVIQYTSRRASSNSSLAAFSGMRSSNPKARKLFLFQYVFECLSFSFFIRFLEKLFLGFNQVPDDIEQFVV